MSYTSIPDLVKLLTWVRAGGRCEFRGCNDLLWRDDLTMQAMNKAYLAHIVADKPGGPRGDPTESDRLKADPSNIMLLCDTCHRRIDGKKTWHEYPVDLLRAMKQEHEERIERQTGIQYDMKTHVLLFGTRIRDRRGQVSKIDAYQAIVAERYPADDHGIIIDLSDIHVNEDAPEFWGLVQAHIKGVLGCYFVDKVGPTGKPLNHLSVFAIAPIPALIYLGKLLGDIVPMEIYQLHRNPHGWQWQELQDPDFRYLPKYPESAGRDEPKIVVNLSLTGKIHASEIEQVIGAGSPTYTLTISRPRQDFLQAQEQREWFRYEWYQLLADIRHNHGENCEIHLFTAVPNSIAVEIGRAILPTLGLRIFVYNKYPDGFRFALEV